MKKRATTTPFATLCSLALLFWGYQTGAWTFAIPMILLLEARHFIPRRWSISVSNLEVVYVVGGFLWLVSIFYIPFTSIDAISSAAIFHILKSLPVGFFPLILAQTYCSNFTSLYRASFSQPSLSKINLNLYYPYFGICLLAAAATGGHVAWFLTVTALLVAGLLVISRSQRFGLGTFYGLIGLALIVSLLGTYQYYWFQTNFKPDVLFSQLVQKVASLAPQDNTKQSQELPKPESEKVAQRPEQVAAKPPQSTPQTTTGPSAQQGAEPPQSTTQPNENSQPSPDSKASSGESQAAANNNSEQSATPSSSGSEAAQNTTQAPDNTSNNNSSSTSQSAAAENSGSVASSQGSASSPANESTGTSGSDNGAAPAQGSNQQGEGTGSPNSAQSSANTPSNSNGITTSTARPNPIGGASGAINPQTTVSQIGNQGTLQPSNAVLFRVAPLNTKRLPTYPLYIRLAAYNQYDLGRWDAVQSQFFPKASYVDKQRWGFGPQNPETFSVRISETLQQGEGVLKLPIGTAEVKELAVDSMKVNQYGTVTFQRKPGKLSYVVEFDPTRSPDGPPTPQDLEIPQIEQPALQKILQSLSLQGKSAQEQVQTVEAFFGQGFQYSLNLNQPQNGETPLAAFLLDHRAGHCEYFASATSLLLRAAGIPTRYTVGYAVDEYSSAEQQYVVRASNAHAWVMAYVNGSWVTVETTPGDGLSLSANRSGGSSADGTVSQNGGRSTPSRAQPSQADNNNATSTQQNQVEEGHSFGEKLSEVWSSLRSYFSQTSDTGAATLESKPSQNNHNTKPSQKKASQKNHTDKNNSTDKTTVEKNKSKEGKSFFEQLSEIWSSIRAYLAKHRDTVLWAALIATLGLIIIIGSITVAWRVLRRKFLKQSKRSRNKISLVSEQPTADGLDSEFYLLEKRLGEWGLARKPSETARQWIARLQQKLPQSQMHSLNQIIDLHYRYRFDPDGITDDDRDQLRSMIQTWLKETNSKVLTK